MRNIDELRPVSALRLLTIWRESGEEDPLVRSLLSNAGVLAACCYAGGEAVYADAEDVLADLSPREMEQLLNLLAGGGGQLNPAFDETRFRSLREV